MTTNQKPDPELLARAMAQHITGWMMPFPRFEEGPGQYYSDRFGGGERGVLLAEHAEKERDNARRVFLERAALIADEYIELAAQEFPPDPDLEWLMFLIIARIDNNAEYHRAKDIIMRLGGQVPPGTNMFNAAERLTNAT